VPIDGGQAEGQLELGAIAMSGFERGQPVGGAAAGDRDRSLPPRRARGSRPVMLRGVILDAAFHARGHDHMVEISANVTICGVFDRRRLGRSRPEGAWMGREAPPLLAWEPPLATSGEDTH
jgi:hypothetical protein